MSDDIVTRLRTEVAKAENDGRLLSWELAKCAWRAADEIERLRHERNEWFIAAKQLSNAVISAKRNDSDEALDRYLRTRGNLEDPREAAQ